MKFFMHLIGVAILGGIVTAAYAGPADLFIISPAPGEVIFGNRVALKVELSSQFTLTNPELYPTHVSGQGHLHIWIDALPSHDDAVSSVLTDTLEHTLENISPGLHTIYVELFRNDHAAYEPRVITSVEFENTVTLISPQGESPQPEVGAPGSGSGIFLPPGRSNTILSIVLILVALLILWHLFERRKKI